MQKFLFENISMSLDPYALYEDVNSGVKLFIKCDEGNLFNILPCSFSYTTSLSLPLCPSPPSNIPYNKDMESCTRRRNLANQKLVAQR